VPPEERELTQQELAAARNKFSLRRRARLDPDPSQQGIGTSKGSPIRVSVRGPDWNTLVEQACASATSGVKRSRDRRRHRLSGGLPEVMIKADRARTPISA
jgi:hypothetical protein